MRPRSALSAPTKRPSSPTYRFRHSNLTRIPAANVLSRPDKDRILRRDKEPPPSVNSRFPDVPVTSGLKNVSCFECKSPSRFQRELDSRSRQTSLMSRPFEHRIRPSSIFGGFYELTQSSGSSLCGLEVQRSTLLKARGDTRSDDSLTALGTLSTLSRQTSPELRAFSFHERNALDYRCMLHTKVRKDRKGSGFYGGRYEQRSSVISSVRASCMRNYSNFMLHSAQIERLIFLLCLQSNNTF